MNRSKCGVKKLLVCWQPSTEAEETVHGR